MSSVGPQHADTASMATDFSISRKDPNDGGASTTGERVQKINDSMQSAMICLRTVCGCQYNPLTDRLEYDYNYDDSAHQNKPQPLPRIRKRGEHYVDSFNGESWSCTFGTHEEVSQKHNIYTSNIHHLSIPTQLDNPRIKAALSSPFFTFLLNQIFLDCNYNHSAYYERPAYG